LDNINSMEQSNTQVQGQQRFPYLILLSAFLALIAPAISHNGFEEYRPTVMIFLNGLRRFRSDWPGVIFIGAYIFVYFILIYGALRFMVFFVRRFTR